MGALPVKPVAFAVHACLLVCLAALGAGASDASTGRVAGVLRDGTGAVLPGATVEIRGLESREVRRAVTDRAGRYAFDALPAGPYALTATASGFEKAVRPALVVGANEDATVDFTLAVARRTTTVEVLAPAGARPLAIETDPRTPRQPIPSHDGADYLKTIPGFAVIRKGGTDGDPVLRGMAGSRLGILLDGEAVLGGCGNRMDPPTAYAFPEAYDRITVLKGPQTVVHGPGNSAGVVLFERDPARDPERGIHVYASPVLGSFGRNDQVADVAASGGKAYLRMTGTRSAMDDYDDGGGRSVHSRYQRWSANTAVGWTPDASTRVELSAARSDGEAAYADRAMDGVAFARDNMGLRFERVGVWRALRSLDARAYYNYVDHVMDNYSLRAFTPSPAMPGPAVSNPDRRTVGGRLALGLELPASLSATVGADWQENRHSLRRTSNQAADDYASHPRARDARFENLGAFAEVTRTLGTRGRVVAGARLDRWTGRDDRTAIPVGMSSLVNPTAGLVRRETLASGFVRVERELAAGTSVYAGAGRAARAPDYWELVSKEAAASVSAFGTRPERTTQLDAGLLFARGAVAGSAAFFVNGIDDFILVQGGYAKPAGTGQRKATIARNVAASSWGGEAALAWEAMPGLKVDGSLAYVRGRNATDDLPLAQVPPLEGRLAVRYARDPWSVGALARFVGAQDRFALNQGNIAGQDLGPTAGFAVFSANGAWRVARKLELSAGVDNLLDREYAEFVARAGAAVPGFTPATRLNEPGRTLWAKLAVRY